MNDLKAFFLEEDGLGTIEIVVIIIILIGLALLFQTEITDFLQNNLFNTMKTKVNGL